MAKASREDWAKRVERWKDSGLTAKEFAAETGLNASTLSYWKWRLGAEQRDDDSKRKPKTRPARCDRPKRGPKTPTFVEVTAQAPVAEPLELVMPGELRVRVPVGFDEATLAAVLRVAGARP